MSEKIEKQLATVILGSGIMVMVGTSIYHVSPLCAFSVFIAGTNLYHLNTD